SNRVEQARLGGNGEIVQVSVQNRIAVAEAADRLTLHLDIRDDIDLGQALYKAAAVLLDGCMVEVAETTAECDQILIAEHLTAEQQHRMFVPGVHHAGERGGIHVTPINASA